MLMFLHFLVVVCLSASASSRSFISYAALGDSYPSGNGVGTPESFYCGRFSGAYPYEVAKQLVLELKNLACAGALTTTILTTQVPLVGESDLVSVQVGGNEADFFGVLNACVEQWLPSSSCKEEVDTARNIIESTFFNETYHEFVSGIKSQLDSSVTLLVLGYARFFNQETDECDHISFSKSDPQNFLTKDKRRALNDLLSSLNSIIRDAAEAYGALYVDIDQVFEGHRFCEAGIAEPIDSASWFFSGTDVFRDQLLTFNTNPPILVNPQGGFFELTRTFHPTAAGHMAIANRIINISRDLE